MAILLVLSVVLIRGIEAGPAVISNAEQSGHFVPMVRTAVTAMEMHPDSETEQPPVEDETQDFGDPSEKPAI